MRRPSIASARFPNVRKMKSPNQVKPVHTRGYPDVRKPQFGYHHIMKNPSLKDPGYQPFGNKEFIRKASSHKTVVDQHPSTVFDETKRRMDPLERAKMGLPLIYKAPGQEYMTRSLKYKARGGRPIARGTFIRESRLEEESEKIASDISQGRGYAESEVDKLKKRIPKRKKPEPEGPITGGSLLEIAEKDKARHEQSEKEYNERVKNIAHGKKPEGDKRPLKEKAISFIKADKFKMIAKSKLT